MIGLKLSDKLFFTIERNEKQARLIVYEDGVENVCRKESIKNLERFISSDAGRIFKGRLQLHKNTDGICIEVKGKIAGIVKAEDFIDCLQQVKNMCNK